MTALLEAVNVSKAFGTGRSRFVALDDFSLTVLPDRPTITAIAGESGSGKTTMGHVAPGLYRADRRPDALRQGPVGLVQGRSGASFGARCRRSFRDPFEVYNPFYKVDHVLTVAHGQVRPGCPSRRVQALIEKALTVWGCAPRRRWGAIRISSAAANASASPWPGLILQPKLIIADEPVSMVDASLRATILQSLRKLSQEMGISILYITHDLATAYHICKGIMVLYQASWPRPATPSTWSRIRSTPIPSCWSALFHGREPGVRWGSLDTVVAGDEASSVAQPR